MTIKQINTYLSNEDESVISFEEINEAYSEDFATYTICLLMDNGAGMYKYDEMIYEHREINEYGIGKSNSVLELEGNKVRVRNMSDAKDFGLLRSFYHIDDPLYGDELTNFFFDPMYKLAMCDSREIPPSYIKEDKESFDKCKAKRALERTYVKEIFMKDSLMSFKRDGKLYAIKYYQYHDILMGAESLANFEKLCIEGNYFKCEMVPIKYSYEDIATIDFDNNTQDLSLFLLAYDVVAINGSKMGWLSEIYNHIESNHSLAPDIGYLLRLSNITFTKNEALMEEMARLDSDSLEKVYQDPTRKCYSPRVDRFLKKKKERITLNLPLIAETFESIGQSGSSVTPFVEIHVHLQGQFLRTIGKDIASYILDDFFADCPRNGWAYFGGTCHGRSISFDLSQVTLLKSRHNSKVQCDADLIDEDTMFLKTVLDRAGIRCIPMYWNSIIKNKLNYSECTTDLQYKKIVEATSGFASYENIRGSFNPPCKEMMIMTNVRLEPGRQSRFYNIVDTSWGIVAYDEMLYLDIDIRHVSERYQAIINKRGFSGESCWAGIGGFVGIFVGVSLMQVPELLMEAISLIKKLKSNVLKLNGIETK